MSVRSVVGVVVGLVLCSSEVQAFTTSINNGATFLSRKASSSVTSLNALESSTSTSRGEFIKTVLTSTAAVSLAAPGLVMSPQSANAVSVGDKVNLPSGVTYEVLKVGDGNQPRIGELVGIRFKAYCGDNKIDDIFDTPEPYYTRIGAGGLLKGVEEVLPKMSVGDRYNLVIPGDLAFGPKGRPASAGKPRIPSNAVITFEVEMVGLPGREPELIDLIGDD